MGLVEDQDDVLVRDRILDALELLQRLASKIRRNNEVNPDFDQSSHSNLLNIASGAAQVFQSDLEALSSSGGKLFDSDEASKFLNLIYEICSWIEIGLPEQIHFLAALKDSISKYMSSYAPIFVDRSDAENRISSPMCGPYDWFNQLGSISVPDTVFTEISREPLVHMRSRLYVLELYHARESLSEVRGELESAQSDIKKLRDGLAVSLENHRVSILAESQKLVDNVTAAVTANEAATKSINENDKLLQTIVKGNADSALTKHYLGFENSRKIAYWALFGLALASFFTAAWFGIGITLHWSGPIFPDEHGLVRDGQIVAESIARIAIVTLLTGLGAFLAKQAGHYRKLYHWAASIGLQLKTFEAYIKDVSDEAHKNQLRAEFSRRVFGQEPGGDLAQSDDNSIPASLLPVITEVIRTMAKPVDKG